MGETALSQYLTPDQMAKVIQLLIVSDCDIGGMIDRTVALSRFLEKRRPDLIPVVTRTLDDLRAPIERAAEGKEWRDYRFRLHQLIYAVEQVAIRADGIGHFFPPRSCVRR